ncbi:MAG: oxaloacetate decarboxylase subunit alpha [Clostridia bacterium]|nr:oxaloacetate decarboxylase subunit alpha [Clostridia bacterium]
MKIRITETVLRDGQQSLMATRMPIADFLPVLEKMDQAGYYSLECWGGATFDSCLRYLDEDPWERLRTIRKHVKNTKLQMLLRGQNLLGYKHYPDDIVRAFVRKSVECGIDIIRIFDALNDLRNIRVAVDEAIKAGAHVSGTLCYTTSPIHNLESFVELGKELEAMGCHSICIKDMAGIMSPKEAFDLVSALKKAVKLPIVVHTHGTTGMGSMTLLKAAEAGADVIDCAIACLSGGTSQPPTETMHYVLNEMGWETGLDANLLKEINDFFKPVRDSFIKSGMLNPIVMGTDPDALTYQVPGGMLSNLVAQLTAQNKLDRFQEVLEEVPRVRKDLGYPPLVTPSSQMVGVQATNNVLAGERYKMVSKEIKAYLRGEYGKAPGQVDENLRKQVLGDEQPVTCRFADLLEPGFEKYKNEIGELARSEEDVLSYAAFPQVAEGFLQRRKEREERAVKYTIEEI